MEKHTKTQHNSFVCLLKKTVKEHTSKRRMMTDFTVQMTDRADSIVTKWGKSDQILLMGPQRHSKRESFSNKIEEQTTCLSQHQSLNLLSRSVFLYSLEPFLYHWIKRFSNAMSRFSFLGSLVDISSVAPVAAHLHFLTQCSNFSRLCGPTRAANQPTQNRRKLTKIMLCVAQQIAHHQSRWKGRRGKIIHPQSNAVEQMQFM